MLLHHLPTLIVVLLLNCAQLQSANSINDDLISRVTQELIQQSMTQASGHDSKQITTTVDPLFADLSPDKISE